MTISRPRVAQRMTAALALTLLSISGLSAAEQPEPSSQQRLAPRESAAIAPAGNWSVGVFNPIEWSLSDSMAVRAHPWPVLRPVTVDLRWRHLAGRWTVTGEYGVALAGLGNLGALPLGIKGDLVPSCKVTAHDASKSDSCEAPGFTIVPRAGVVASTGSNHVITARADIAVGVPLGARGKPLDAWPNLDLAWAGAHNGFRARIGGRYDRSLTANARWAGELSAFLVQPDGGAQQTSRSPLTLSLWTGLDVGVGDHSRFTIGVIYYNSDQRRTEMVDQGGYAVRERVRSHDFFPTIDFIWAG